MNWNYDAIKSLARDLRRDGNDCRVTDLIALAPQNDPFYIGSPGEREKAEWFADIWNRFGYRHGVHLRRVHYQLVSQEELVRKPDGVLYENTERDWAYLGVASKCARYLGLVELDAFVDRRNPEPRLHAEYGRDPTPSCGVFEESWQDLDLARLEATGYIGPLQPYHLEVWVEKTTMNDILDPLCRRYKVNLVTGAGEMSITATRDLVERMKVADRPCRVFYVSDFDPAGYGMPVSVARKVEWMVRTRHPGLDMQLEPIALTRDQVIEHRLPRQPIKESERRRGAFEDTHGEGAVELDALEALRPGVLATIVKAAILDYYDQDIEDKARRERWRLQNMLDEIEAETLADLEPEIEAVTERVRALRQTVRERLREASDEIDLDDYPLPESDLVTEANGVLFDTARGYLDQLESYNARADGER